MKIESLLGEGSVRNFINYNIGIVPQVVCVAFTLACNYSYPETLRGRDQGSYKNGLLTRNATCNTVTSL